MRLKTSFRKNTAKVWFALIDVAARRMVLPLKHCLIKFNCKVYLHTVAELSMLISGVNTTITTIHTIRLVHLVMIWRPIQPQTKDRKQQIPGARGPTQPQSPEIDNGPGHREETLRYKCISCFYKLLWDGVRFRTHKMTSSMTITHRLQ